MCVSVYVCEHTRVSERERVCGYEYVRICERISVPVYKIYQSWH